MQGNAYFYNNGDHLQDEQPTEDYYAFLNLPRDAELDEITSAYRRLSRFYHPDRHCNASSELLKHAENLFNRTKKAYEVLSDPAQRAIYDTVGVEGLLTEGWEVVERRSGPDEIRLEYERLKRLRDEELLLQRTNPTGSFTVTVNATDLFEPFDPDDYEEHVNWEDVAMPEISSMSLSQSAEASLTINDRIIFGGSLDVKNGNGIGTITCAWRRLINSSMWSEVEVGIGEHVGVSCKIFRTFSKKMFGHVELLGRFNGNQMYPGLQIGVTRQLDTKLQGSLVAKFGLQNSFSPSITYNDGKSWYLNGALVVGIPQSYTILTMAYRFVDNEARLKSTIKFGVFGAVVDVSYERKVSDYNKITTAVRFISMRGLIVRFRLQRGLQSYQLNIVLCDDDLYSNALWWGVAAPVVFYNLIKFAIKPFIDNRKLKQIRERQKNAETFIDSKRCEAEAAVNQIRNCDLMRPIAERVRQEETTKPQGLVIMEAWYGKLLPDIQAEYKL